VTYHDACHLAHAQRVREAPRRLLRALPGVELVELPNADWCCGSAGVYNLTHPEMAEKQLEGKLAAVERVTPEVVIASNPGCLLHMRRGATARGMAPRFVHLVELLGEAFPRAGADGSVTPPQLSRRAVAAEFLRRQWLDRPARAAAHRADARRLRRRDVRLADRFGQRARPARTT